MKSVSKMISEHRVNVSEMQPNSRTRNDRKLDSFATNSVRYLAFLAMQVLLALPAHAGASSGKESCDKHKVDVAGCTFCYEGTMPSDQAKAFTLRWTNDSDSDVVIRKSSGARLAIKAEQLSVAVAHSKDFLGVFDKSSLWFPLEQGSSELVTVVFSRSQSDLVDVPDGLLLVYKNVSINKSIPIASVRVSVDRARYDFEKRQAGAFRSESQCLFFYAQP